MGGWTWLNLSNWTMVIVIRLAGGSGRRPMASLVHSILQGEVAILGRLQGRRGWWGVGGVMMDFFQTSL